MRSGKTRGALDARKERAGDEFCCVALCLRTLLRHGGAARATDLYDGVDDDDDQEEEKEEVGRLLSAMQEVT